MITGIFDLIFPQKCVLCGRILRKAELDLCGRCRAEAPEYDRMDGKIPHASDMTAVWYYEKEVRRSMIRYKFRNKRCYASGYGRVLAMRISKDLKRPDLIVWVPVSRKRLSERGYDQVELLAQAAARELDVPCLRALEKWKDNPPNSSLESAAERKKNVRGVYRAVNGDQISGARVVLVDDVITTGATMGECAGVLRRAGAKDVMCAAVAAGRNT